MKRYIKAFSIPNQLYAVRDDYGYLVLSLIYTVGDGYKIVAEDGFASDELSDMSDDGYTISFDVLGKSAVVDAWNSELSARNLSGQITLDEFRQKVRNCYL
jgi:hypothetical protein